MPMQCFMWNGEAMIPARAKAADKEYVIGRRYWLEEVSDRSWISHRHEFAWIKRGSGQSAGELRRHVPVAGASAQGGADRNQLAPRDDHRRREPGGGGARGGLRRGEDEFARVVVRGSTVVIQKARSQRMHGHDRMDKAEFQQSKDDILGWISELLGVAPERLRGAA